MVAEPAGAQPIAAQNLASAPALKASALNIPAKKARALQSAVLKSAATAALIMTAMAFPQAAFAMAQAGGASASAVAADTASAAPTIPVQLSVGGMFLQADWLVKLVMIGLLFASLATWTVFIAKTRELRRANGVLQQEHDALTGLKSLADAAALPRLSHSPLLREAQAEIALSADVIRDGDGVKERIISRFDRLEAATARRMTRGVTVIATIGSTAPFVGLFGTVWGIMNSFVGIAEKQTTNLAVVAPGIAEALLATALGLVAAIPAVVIYNHFARKVAAHRALLSDTAAAILRLVSRDISHAHAVAGQG
jgi:biopolymer transport protein ExbB